ncbi:MAG: hypothetical protein IIW36_01400 [Clostridia bacterium]|jgi:hypothetical protein|nr:hypothetical protein [Clostridia bacterium]
MLFFKLLGSILILLSGSAAAFCAVRYESARIRILDAWIDLILFIRGQIDCYLTPLDEILQKANAALPESALLGHASPKSLDALLHQSKLYLCADTHRLLTAFVREIGSSYREDQLKQCDYYIQALRSQREQLASQLPSRTKLSATLCLCLALGTAILLW